MKEKKYDLYFENSVKVKSLNDDYFKCYQEIEKALFKKQKNTLKTNVLLAEIIKQMISSQEKGKTVQQLVGQNTQSFVDQINKKLNYKEKINQILINMKCLVYYLQCASILYFFLLKSWWEIII